MECIDASVGGSVPGMSTSPDRAVAMFADADEVRRHEASIRAILVEWVAQTQGA